MRELIIIAPLMHCTKQDIVELSKSKNINNTYSCHAGTIEPCTKCIACLEFAYQQKGETMGGGTGGRSLSESDYDDFKKKILESAAKKAINQPLSDQGKKNVFISFAHEDKSEVDLLRGQAKAETNDLEFNDWSLKVPFDSKNAEYIKRGITERIKQSSVTLCYITEHTASSQWVNWEIQKSLELGKKVVCVYKGDTPPKALPKAATENSLKLVQWNHQEIKKVLED